MSDLIKQLRHEVDIFRKGGANGRADLIGNAADLIEQQAAEIDALKAHVEQLSSNLLWLVETVETDFIPNLEDYMELKEHIDSIKALANQSPQASLAERDAEVARGSLIALRSKLKGEDWEDDELRIFLDDFTDEYAERIKWGEV